MQGIDISLLSLKHFEKAGLMCSPEEPLWSAEQMQKARTLLGLAAGSERLQKALRVSGYRGPFPRAK